MKKDSKMKVKKVFIPQEFSIFYVAVMPDDTQKMFYSEPARKLTEKDLFPADGLSINKLKGGTHLHQSFYGQYGLEMIK